MPAAPFKLTTRQEAANELLAGPAGHVLLYGGSRSGKTFLIVRGLVLRALKAPSSRHAMLRLKHAHIKQAVVMDTFPKVMRLCFPNVHYDLNKSDQYALIDTVAEPSEVWFSGLDDNDRVEKILGNEYATIALTECSQIPFESRNMALTRLAQQVDQQIMVGDKMTRRPLRPRAWYDENPPDKAHWTYRLFIQGIDPESKQALPNRGDYAAMQLNPEDNVENLAASYIDQLRQQPVRMQRRFLFGQFRDANPNALFVEETFDAQRVLDLDTLPAMQRVVVAVDPSGSDDTDNLENDEIGIVVAGLGTDGDGYLLEDATVKMGPAGWGGVVCNAYDQHQGDRVVAETNYGGAMVKSVIQTARRQRGQPPVPFTAVTASRGKAVRAEPISALVEQGRIKHAGYFHKLEDELVGFTTAGYMGERSPNRADAYIWAFHALFTHLVQPAEKPKSKAQREHTAMPQGWMS